MFCKRFPSFFTDCEVPVDDCQKMTDEMWKAFDDSRPKPPPSEHNPFKAFETPENRRRVGGG